MPTYPTAPMPDGRLALPESIAAGDVITHDGQSYLVAATGSDETDSGLVLVAAPVSWDDP